MKNTITLLFFFIFSNAFSQSNMALHLDNPTPRVGDEVAITKSNNFITQSISSQLGEGISISNKYNSITNKESEFKWYVKFEKSGNQTIGPFVFMLNGQEFKTDSIVLNIREKLEWKEDVWVRYEQVNGSHYIIIEQYLDEKKEGKYKLAELNEKTVDVLYNYREYSTTQSPVFEEGKSDGKKMRYSMQRYKIEILGTNNAPIILTHKNFKNLPRGKEIELRITND